MHITNNLASPPKYYFESFFSRAFVLMFFIAFGACETEDPKPVEEQELITTLTLTFKKSGSTDAPKSFTWTDLDGSGPGSPVVDEIVLDAHSEYELTLTLQNQSVSPVEDVTTEIVDAAEDHQFFFQTKDVEEVIFSYADTDVNAKPIGLTNHVVIEHFGTGSLTVTLIHEPKKDAVGVEGGNPSNAGGETDLQTTFPLQIVE